VLWLFPSSSSRSFRSWREHVDGLFRGLSCPPFDPGIGLPCELFAGASPHFREFVAVRRTSRPSVPKLPTKRQGLTQRAIGRSSARAHVNNPRGLFLSGASIASFGMPHHSQGGYSTKALRGLFA
jgi:hypothetical protein